MNKLKESFIKFKEKRIQKGKLIKAEDLPESEQLYLSKTNSGYKIVHLPVNEDGSWNWMNLLFGGKQNLYNLIGFIVMALLLYVGITELISSYQTIASNPCDFCSNGINQGIDAFRDLNLSIKN